MKKPRSIHLVVLAIAALIGFGIYQHFINTGLRKDLTEFRVEQARMIAKREISQKKRVENDTTRAMRAICILAEYGRSNRSVRGDESVTIRAAKFELLYFTQHYLLRITKGKPAVDFLLSNDVTIEGWAIHGEYYPSLKAISISLEAAKNSTSAQITPDGEIRYLIERIYNWLDKRQKVRLRDN